MHLYKQDRQNIDLNYKKYIFKSKRMHVSMGKGFVTDHLRGPAVKTAAALLRCHKCLSVEEEESKNTSCFHQ